MGRRRETMRCSVSAQCPRRRRGKVAPSSTLSPSLSLSRTRHRLNTSTHAHTTHGQGVSTVQHARTGISFPSTDAMRCRFTSIQSFAPMLPAICSPPARWRNVESRPFTGSGAAASAARAAAARRAETRDASSRASVEENLNHQIIEFN